MPTDRVAYVFPANSSLCSFLFVMVYKQTVYLYSLNGTILTFLLFKSTGYVKLNDVLFS